MKKLQKLITVLLLFIVLLSNISNDKSQVFGAYCDKFKKDPRCIKNRIVPCSLRSGIAPYC